MKLTAKGRYAVMAVADMAAQTNASRPVDAESGSIIPPITPPIIPLSDIAGRQGISIAYLEQLFGKLRKAGIVDSLRGVNGGYRLAHDPRDIRLSSIIAAVNEDIKAHGCTPESKKACNGLTDRCLTHNLWGALELHIANFLEHVSVQDVVDDTFALTSILPAAELAVDMEAAQ